MPKQEGYPQKMKRVLKRYGFVLIIAVLLLAMVLVRAFSPHIFRYDAVRWARPTIDRSCFVTAGELVQQPGKILFLVSDPSFDLPDISGAGILTTDAGSLLTKGNLCRIKQNQGPVVICAADASVAARIWMVLSQMGVRNLYILR